MKLKVLFLLLISHVSFAQNEIIVAAASDLKFAMDSIITSFEQSNSGKIKITYGSSGKLTEQISHGGPFQIFFSADIAYPEQLKAKGFAASEVYPYAVGHLVIWSKKIDTKKGIHVLTDPSIKKIAIANPTHAPYGKRAMEALDYYKLTEKVKPNLVMGENISQTAQFVSTGAADIGIIALSLAKSPNMQKENGNYSIIPAASHQPLIQGAIITREGKDNKLAADFFDFVKSEKAAGILKHFGFDKP